jgi:FKBP-type peptidyl-prolyl cis-trans isomerase
MIRTNSGLVYRELVTGTGAGYTSSSTGVRVNYKGYTSDGDLFDSGTNSSFALTGVIAGFAEGLKTMKVGGTSQFIISADLAYGNAAPSNGKPIIFLVDLLAFTP